MKFSSQEQLFKVLSVINYLILILLSLSFVWVYTRDGLYVVTAFMVFTPIYTALFYSVYNQFFAPYRAMQTALDAIRFSDTSVKTVPIYQSGVAAQLHHELEHITTIFGQWQSEQNQHALLVNELLQALDSPILIVNQDYRLIMGNVALTHWLDADWRLKKLEIITEIGFRRVDEKWCFTNGVIAAAHQLRGSEISLNGEKHHLLLISNIKSELKQSQTDAWRQLVKVLSHEIKNSLTPIKSIAQTLEQFSHDDTQKQMLSVIVERSVHLQQFVSNYSSLERQVELRKCNVALHPLFLSVRQLYPHCEISLLVNVEQWNLDPILIEQVLINLLKNAMESCEAGDIVPHIALRADQNEFGLTIDVIDNGIGLGSAEHLFVPLYTTKQHGQGIGLVWCRKVIEQHGGTLTLTAREGSGAVATLVLHAH
ncbi:PAS domain-containing sensor histidine kinase [Pseudoalteromonas sp. MMG012]|uniref:sensor histidine kinase n=1 Tax=Pseudoalteromonas sp. MMG012 TaxID=2822686 RepID=UPI001B3A3FE0|nr:ATP-binding protein [Pseudoalteromonas sp. MMG012]MBQ4852429.1 GHKL domain-containing protein [Pseudoalteromonas sp. MMG012]